MAIMAAALLAGLRGESRGATAATIEQANAAVQDPADLFSGLYDWVASANRALLEQGQPLTEAQLEEAVRIGIAHPEKIRLVYLPEIPEPDASLLSGIGSARELWDGDSLGLTLGYAMCLRADQKNNRGLLVHELVHVAQHERLGGLDNFLARYVEEFSQFGYWDTPLEKEAYEMERRANLE